MYGLLYFFLALRPDDSLYKEAAHELSRDRNAFDQSAQRAVQGGSVGGNSFRNVSSSSEEGMNHH